ncbi:toxin PIN, partial [Mobiluncus curtisii]|nr:toxin PIN [Mobiluncus curtisii]
QVTDVYLTELAQHHDALLATFDQGIVALRPDATFLIQ